MLQADVSVLQWRRGTLSSECADGWEWRGGLGGCEQDRRRWCQSNAILVADDFDQVQCKPSVVHECFRCFLMFPTPVAVPCPFSNGFFGNPIPVLPLLPPPSSGEVSPRSPSIVIRTFIRPPTLPELPTLPPLTSLSPPPPPHLLWCKNTPTDSLTLQPLRARICSLPLKLDRHLTVCPKVYG